MTRRMILSLLLLMVLILLVPRMTSAGGWAIVELDELPGPLYAGEPVRIGFTLRQHGDKPFSGEPTLTAHNLTTDKTIRVEGKPEGETGHHVVEVTFPSAGVWDWSIMPSPFPNANQFYPLRVLPPESEVSAGQALFVAKGCIGCHTHPEVDPSQFAQGLPLGVSNPWTGVNLGKYEGTPEFLRVWLKNPQAVRPNTAMPNLNLSNEEIEALIAFINRTEPAETTAAAAVAAPEATAIKAVDTNLASLSEAADDETFYVRPDGPKGALAVYDMAAEQHQFDLPPGMLSADEQHYFTTTSQGERTTWRMYDPRTGTLKKRLSVPGQWTVSAVSQTGRWLTLTQLVEATKRQAEVSPVGLQVIDTETGLVKHRLELAGDFEVEAISPGGDSLFLIEYLGDKEPPEYAVRIYDLAADSLDPNPLRSKTAADEIMAGYAWGGVASPDGRWLLTLYLNTNRQVAFIHALNLVDKFPICLFLPSGAGDFEQLKDYTLTLSADGRQVFAANPSLGVVAEVSLESFETLRQVEFEALLTASKSASAQTAGPTNHSLLSPDGRQLYFSDSTHVWRYDTRRHQVDGPLSIKAQIDGLGVSADGKQLFVATDDGSVRSFHVGAAALTSLQP